MHHPDPTSSLACDCHFHSFEANRGQPGSRYVPAYAARFDDWQAAAQRTGVERGVLVQTSFMGHDHRLLLAQLAAEPQRLRGVAVPAPGTGPCELQALHAQGIRAIRFNLVSSAQALADWGDAASALWDALLALGWHVELHTAAGRLPETLAQLPRALPLVLDHMAMPQAAVTDDPTVRAVLERAAKSAAPVHVKLSGAYRLAAGCDAGTLARLWSSELGADRLLWGSDWPCTNHERQADYALLFAQLADWLRNDDAAIKAARATNPARLYWGEPAASPAGTPHR